MKHHSEGFRLRDHERNGAVVDFSVPLHPTCCVFWMLRFDGDRPGEYRVTLPREIHVITNVFSHFSYKGVCHIGQRLTKKCAKQLLPLA